MSLNGLDDPKINEAYQSALAEAGGWFLLGYISRDEVELYKRGSGGLPEARASIAEYTEPSPLFGFLLYRRRKVLIKYLPEATSRLLKARLAVHFQSVTEKFTPHDTVFSCSAYEDLNDITLSAACSLHTAAPSTCSSTASSRKKRLDGITEDAEETQESEEEPRLHEKPSTWSMKPEETAETSEKQHRHEDEASQQAHRPPTARRPSSPSKTSTFEDKADDSKSLKSVKADARPSISSEIHTKNFEHLYQPSDDRRFSSQTARPSAAELYEIYHGKPKVKLGPRPKVSLESGRPNTSGSGSRPVSSLPPGMKSTPRKNSPMSRPGSRDSLRSTKSALAPPPPPVPAVPDTASLMTMRKNSTAGSVRSLPAAVHRMAPSPGMTPEKQRLQKAVELRKKQMAAKQEKEARNREAKEEEQARSEVAEKEEVDAGDIGKIEEEEVTPTRATETTPAHTSPAKADSGIDVERVGRDDPISGPVASSPVSMRGSSVDQSTRPSSISEEDGQRYADNSEKTRRNKQASQNAEISDATSLTQSEDASDTTPTVVPEEPSPSNLTTEPTLGTSPVPDPPVDEVQKGDVAPLPQPKIEVRPHTSTTASPSLEDTTSTSLPGSSSPSRPQTAPKDRRRALVEPLHIHSAENSDLDYLSDDSFIEELQSATVLEAKPISVSKSPITPIFPVRRTSSNSTSKPATRSNSNTVEQEMMDVASTSPTAQEQARKSNVSSGISQRIKALSEKSNRESAASLSPASISGENAPTSPSWRKPSQPSSNGRRLSRMSMFSPQATNVESPKSPQSPKSPKQSAPALQPPTDAVHTVYNVQQDKPDSVSVTARIVRDERSVPSEIGGSNDSGSTELLQSPLTINHHRSNEQAQESNPPASSPQAASPQPASPQATSPQPMSPQAMSPQAVTHERSNSKSSLPASPPSRDSSAAFPPRTSSDSSWRSLGRRKSDVKSTPQLEKSPSVRSLSIKSPSNTSMDEERSDEKKGSKSSRFFKRMSSSITLGTRKNIANVMAPTKEEEEQTSQRDLPPVQEPPPSVQVGDLNIQFPDNLLWKRRWVEIDGQGNVVLSMTKSNARIAPKRYHLSQFRSPYVPDLDRQEMPHSIILDFTDGSTLQCACETSVAQVHVLQILKEAHSAWMAFGH